jgi:hypothetical protein
MTTEQTAGVGLGLFACLIGLGGIVAAVRTRRRRAEIASTYGSTGGIVYTAIQMGCSGVLILGGIGMILVAFLFKR